MTAHQEFLDEQVAHAQLNAFESAEPHDRKAWRQYACAALSGLCAREQSMSRQCTDDCVEEAASAADSALELEKQRFDAPATAGAEAAP